MFDTDTIRILAAKQEHERNAVTLTKTTFSGEKLTRFINLKTLCGCLFHRSSYLKLKRPLGNLPEGDGSDYTGKDE
jgi:hypothetical protein